MYLEQFPFPRQEMMVNVCVYLLLNVKCLLQRFFFSSHVASWMQFSSCSSSLRARTEDRGKWKVFEEVITRHYWWLSDKRTLLSIMPTLHTHVCTVARYSAQHTAQLMLAVNLQIVTCQLVINVAGQNWDPSSQHPPPPLPSPPPVCPPPADEEILSYTGELVLIYNHVVPLLQPTDLKTVIIFKDVQSVVKRFFPFKYFFIK